MQDKASRSNAANKVEVPEAGTSGFAAHDGEELERQRLANLRQHPTLFWSHVFDRLTRHHKNHRTHREVVTGIAGWGKGEAASRPYWCQDVSSNANRARSPIF